ncbi:hypothetical protein [Dyadobacter sp. Leaf189]|uniref:hypothetical protein n=1 Tax=Dyadobacter sp. Leaf189 TaxID=1736295 RepID=UPI00070176BA|nr:hypothetical protein [Dyadobacter sp. Leaf189]KQS33952.1 hypothetical protein ASG33_07945 [Dyadobacter sp. Leaf189]
MEQSITDRVKSYEDACAIKGIEPLTIEAFGFLPENQREYQFCVHKYDVINEVLNEGWSPDWMNWDERKYFPYFYWDKDKAAGGSGFSFGVFSYDYSGATVGSRLVFRNAELARYAAKQFLDICEVIYSPRQS